MILEASKRSGGMALGRHLLNDQDNDHVSVHEVRGFVSDNVLDAMKEAQAVSMGTRCKQYLFSLSLNPPGHENVRVEVFENAIEKIEERLGLTGQPRMIVFHEKEGRRHAHCVWSRIDADSMTAIDMPFFKTKLRDVSKALYLENGWTMPRGFMDSKLRDPRNFTLEEWQQAKRAGLNAKDLKQAVQECWAVSDGVQTLDRALEEKGLFLARGDARAHVVMTHEGEVFALSRMIGKRAKDVLAKLGEPDGLRSVEETRAHIAVTLTPRLQAHIKEAKRIAANQMKPLAEQRDAMKAAHKLERQRLDDGQAVRHKAETRARAERIRHGWKGLWDRVTGEHAAIASQNEMEAFFCLERDRAQKQALLEAQLKERQELQRKIMAARERHAMQVMALYKDVARFRNAPSRETRQSSRERGQGLDRGLGLG
ncbi:relaxase/mobilization nuclease domain-containing protein [Asticcacaulis sp. AND118]|uniref:relaxase/mobilization nuclease domain-containing protein n=1 Tax=Asticcacaulis sp. AND118 TaxID=2840468 RepID=UPI001D001992|nr:relaxase/mobilization nuclease domain-containing protein [Asticcacaulis sp. AND118]UDF05360.1 relaxase/mobilization nuclease domain-containing protein [Asticcacaulis sp. AND118]